MLNLQVNYWNSNVNEVQGVVIDQEGKVVHRLFGKWHEGLYCGVAPSAKCIWRPGKKVVMNSGRHCSVTLNYVNCFSHHFKYTKYHWSRLNFELDR